MNENRTVVHQTAQDYIILGKSTKDTEVRINIDAEDYDRAKRKVENIIRLQAYAESLYTGRTRLPDKFDSDGKPLDGV